MASQVIRSETTSNEPDSDACALPVEILQQIVDFIPHVELYNYLTVNSAFHSLVLKRLYRHLRITQGRIPTPNRKELLDLVKTVDVCPHAWDYCDPLHVNPPSLFRNRTTQRRVVRILHDDETEWFRVAVVKRITPPVMPPDELAPGVHPCEMLNCQASTVVFRNTTLALLGHTSNTFRRRLYVANTDPPPGCKEVLQVLLPGHVVNMRSLPSAHASRKQYELLDNIVWIFWSPNPSTRWTPWFPNPPSWLYDIPLACSDHLCTRRLTIVNAQTFLEDPTLHATLAQQAMERSRSSDSTIIDYISMRDFLERYQTPEYPIFEYQEVFGWFEAVKDGARG